jgi:hypothetical protein
MGTGGCGPCIALIVKCKKGVAVFHFTAGDAPCCSLGVGWDGKPILDWLDCTGIICGGDDSRESNCLADEVVHCAIIAGIKLKGVSGKSACGLNPDGSWYDAY